MHDELLALARRLDKRGVSGVYGLVAHVADQVALLKQQGKSTIAALARGLDALKQIDDTHTGKRLNAMREAMAEHEETTASAVIALLFAIGCAIAGFASDPGWFYISIFVSAVAGSLHTARRLGSPHQTLRTAHHGHVLDLCAGLLGSPNKMHHTSRGYRGRNTRSRRPAQPYRAHSRCRRCRARCLTHLCGRETPD